MFCCTVSNLDMAAVRRERRRLGAGCQLHARRPARRLGNHIDDQAATTIVSYLNDIFGVIPSWRNRQPNCRPIRKRCGPSAMRP